MNTNLACKLAVYDYSHHSPDGTLWAWRPTLDPSSILDTLLSLALSTGALNEKRFGGDRSGGLCCTGDLAAVFRIVDGGRDERNRPGRRIIAFLIVSRASLLNADVGSLFESTAFKEIADLAARGGRLPHRDASRLECVVCLRAMSPSIIRYPRIDLEGRFMISGQDALASIGDLMQQFSRSAAVAICFDVTAMGCSGRLCSQINAGNEPNYKETRDSEFFELESAGGPTSSSPSRDQGVVSSAARTLPFQSLIRKTLGTSIKHTLGAFLIVGGVCFLVGVLVGIRVGGSRSAADGGEQTGGAAKPIVPHAKHQTTPVLLSTPPIHTSRSDETKSESKENGSSSEPP